MQNTIVTTNFSQSIIWTAHDAVTWNVTYAAW